MLEREEQQRDTVRVLVLTAEEGEGHTTAARALATELGDHPELEVVVRDALREGMGRLVPLLSRDSYRVQLRWAGWTYGLEYRLFTRFPPTRAIARAGLAVFAARPLLRLIERHRPDRIVSTHPAVTNVLGYLRERGRLNVPTIATVTDFGVHALWANRGIDLHLVMHERCVEPVERVAGPASARVASAIVAPRFREPLPRAEARTSLGLPQDRPVVLVSGGGWGVGDLPAAVEVALTVRSAHVVVVSGRNELLQRRLEATFAPEPRVTVLGFTDRMNELLAAADALVDSSVGVTCLEALTRGCPIVAFGSPPGHSRDNARALARLGLGEHARSRAELARALERVLTQPQRHASLAPVAAASALILAAAPRLRRRAAPWRRALVPVAAALTAVLALTGFAFASPAPYHLVARAFHIRSLSYVPTRQPEVALVLAAPRSELPSLSRVLASAGAEASFAVTAAGPRTLGLNLAARGDEVVPALDEEQPLRWLRTKHRLTTLARRLGLGSSFYYLMPRQGLALGDYLAVRSGGGVPVSGAVRFDVDDPLRAARLEPGQVVVVELGRDPLADRARLKRFLSLAAARGLEVVSVSELLDSARSSAPTAGDLASAIAAPSIAASERTSAVAAAAS